MKQQAGSAILTELLKECYFRLGAKLTSTTLIVVLTLLTAFEVSAQTKKKAGDEPQSLSASGLSSAQTTIDRRYLRRGESFSLAYSSYDRDLGKLDDTGSAPRFGYFLGRAARYTESGFDNPAAGSLAPRNAERRYTQDSSISNTSNDPLGAFILRVRFTNSAGPVVTGARYRIGDLTTLCDDQAIFNDHPEYRSASSNSSANLALTYASLDHSALFSNMNDAERSDISLGTFRIRATYRFRDPSDSGLISPMGFSTLDSNPSQTIAQGNKGRFATSGLFATKVVSSTTLSRDGMRINLGGLSKSEETPINDEQAGNYHYSKGEYKEALSYYLQTLGLMNESQDYAAKARILMNIGVIYRALGESNKAVEWFNKAALSNIGTEQTDADALLLYNIALANLDVGETSKALSNFDRVAYHPKLSEKRDTRNNILRGLALNGIGSVYASLGDSTEAISHFNQALQLLKELNDLNGQATTINNLGRIHNALGAYVKALDYLNEALRIRERLADRRGQADTLYDIGNVYANQSKTAESTNNYERSLALFRTINDRSGESLSLRGLGRIYALADQYQQALDYYNASIAIAKALNNRRSIAGTLTDLGRLYKSHGKQQDALASYNRALELTRGLGDKSSEAIQLYEMSLLHRDLGDFDQAQGLIEAALEIVEANRAKVPDIELRSTYSASMQMCYGLYIDLLVSSHIKHPLEGFDARALEASERARARSLLDLLAEDHRDIGAGVDPALLERERLAQQALNSAIAKQTRLLSAAHTEEEKTAVAKEVELSISEYQKIKLTIKSQSRRYEALRTAPPLTVKEIQAQLLDENTLMLSYVLGNDRSFLFAVTNDSLDLFILPKRTVIETEALRAYELLANRPQAPASNTRGAEIERSNISGSFQEANERLGQMLLAPVVRSLGRKRLLIVTEGALQKVPFAALAIPQSGINSNEHPLIVDHEIVNLPSASVLAMLRRETASRKPPPKTIAIFADPVFAASDARIKRTSPNKSQMVSGEDTKRNFDRLLFSRWEADQIAALVPQSESLLATDFAANRSAAISPALSQYRILHFATHGTINEEQPEISSIVLSLFDKEGKAQNGFLRLSEIYDMNLPVELVVLSGCRTGLGQEMPGEGLRSVTQGFMYAGAARVVFSLWAVDDRVTAELMVRFYRKMFSKGLTAAEALRETQVEMWKDDRWSSPYFWAPFVLQGEFK